MSQTSFQRSPEETAEIEKHKYFLSEKAGHDVGWEAAEKDWESKFADDFRRSSNTDFKSEGNAGFRTFLDRLLSRAKR